jgi:hypothetical protein
MVAAGAKRIGLGGTLRARGFGKPHLVRVFGDVCKAVHLDKRLHA